MYSRTSSFIVQRYIVRYSSVAADRPTPYELTRVADAELPRQITVQQMDPARDYQVNSQRARRSTVNSDADLSIELPLVLEAGKAIG